MTYQERITHITHILAQILGTYEAPKHLRDSAEAQRAEVQLIAKMVNKAFPNDTNSDHISGIMETAEIRLKQSHKTRTWPTGAAIADAVKRSFSSPKGGVTSVSLDPFVINANRIKNKEAVGDTWIEGVCADELLEKGLVTSQDLAPYRKRMDWLRSKKLLPTNNFGGEQ